MVFVVEPAGPPGAYGWAAHILEAAGVDEAVRLRALACWPEVVGGREAVPDVPAWCGFLAYLRKRRLHKAALALAHSVAELWPAELWPLLEIMETLGEAPSFKAALDLGQRLHSAAPENPDGPRLVLYALRGLGRRDEAAVFFDSLPVSLEVFEWYLLAGVDISFARRNHERVIALAERLRNLAPKGGQGFTMASMAHRARGEPGLAEELMRTALEHLPNNIDVWREAARTADAVGQTELAFERWAELCRRFPASSAGYIGAIQLSQRIGDAERTDALLAAAAAAFPSHQQILVLAARNAMLRGDLARASHFWDAAIATAPVDPELRLSAAISLRGSGTLRWKQLAPTNERVEAINSEFPDFVPAAIVRVGLLRDLHRLDEADEFATEWASRFPDHAGLAIAYAQIAENRGEFELALARVAQVRGRVPATGTLEAAYVRALSMTGAHSAADAACKSALLNFPDDIALLHEYSTIATRAGDWSGALQRAQMALRLYPHNPSLRRAFQSARTQVVVIEEPGLAGQRPATPDTLESRGGGGGDKKAPRYSRASKAWAVPGQAASLVSCKSGLVASHWGCCVGPILKSTAW